MWIVIENNPPESYGWLILCINLCPQSVGMALRDLIRSVDDILPTLHESVRTEVQYIVWSLFAVFSHHVTLSLYWFFFPAACLSLKQKVTELLLRHKEAKRKWPYHAYCSGKSKIHSLHIRAVSTKLHLSIYQIENKDILNLMQHQLINTQTVNKMYVEDHICGVCALYK